eukprot:11626552-Alexandrium_andersonii.AAC.1
MPEWRLAVGDRLEPCEALPDVGALEDVQVPIKILFWRPSAETKARHRNPIFDDVLGTTLCTLAVDTLHTLNLGVFQE